MPVVSRLWEIQEEGQTVREMELEQPPEEVLEGLVEQHPEMLEEKLLVVGCQMTTQTGPLDLLALDEDARPVVIELKKEDLEREVIAQAVDYASWIWLEEEDDIKERAQEYLDRKVEDAFSERFGSPYEGMLVEEPRIIIVGADVSEPVERMIEYLAWCGVNIRWVLVRRFRASDGKEYYLSETIRPERRRPPKPSTPTAEELQEIAGGKGVREVFEVLRDVGKEEGVTERRAKWGCSYAFRVEDEEGVVRQRVGISASIAQSEVGKLAVFVNVANACAAWGVSGASLREAFSGFEMMRDREEAVWYWLETPEDASRFVEVVSELRSGTDTSKG